MKFWRSLIRYFVQYGSLHKCGFYNLMMSFIQSPEKYGINSVLF